MIAGLILSLVILVVPVFILVRAVLEVKREKMTLEALEEFKDTSPEERAKIWLEAQPRDKRWCASCGKQLRYIKNGVCQDDWILAKTENKKIAKFDNFHSIGGYGTINLKEKNVIVKHYKCPKCGYERTEEN